MKAIWRIETELLRQIHADLDRPHPFAAERVGFVACKVGDLPDGKLILAQSYHPIADDEYEQSERVGAMMGSAAIRNALQHAYNNPCAMFHIHRHDHNGTPRFSPTDVRENAKFIPDFWKVQPNFPHGAIVLSFNAMTGAWWNPVNKQAQYIDELAVIGRPLKINWVQK